MNDHPAPETFGMRSYMMLLCFRITKRYEGLIISLITLQYAAFDIHLMVKLQSVVAIVILQGPNVTSRYDASYLYQPCRALAKDDSLLQNVWDVIKA